MVLLWDSLLQDWQKGQMYDQGNIAMQYQEHDYSWGQVNICRVVCAAE